MDNPIGDKPQRYKIKVQGSLDESWVNWFLGLKITIEKDFDGRPITNLCGQIIDQSELRGILNKLWDLNLSLLSVERLKDDL